MFLIWNIALLFKTAQKTYYYPSWDNPQIFKTRQHVYILPFFRKVILLQNHSSPFLLLLCSVHTLNSAFTLLGWLFSIPTPKSIFHLLWQEADLYALHHLSSLVWHRGPEMTRHACVPPYSAHCLEAIHAICGLSLKAEADLEGTHSGRLSASWVPHNRSDFNRRFEWCIVMAAPW